MKKAIFLLVMTMTLMAFNYNEKIVQPYTVLIDVAHGGSDSGVIGGDGMSEKELSLAIASRIQEVGASKGINIVLTRTADESLSLDKRVGQANELSPDLFISLHLNGHSSNNELSGIECFISKNNPRYEESKKFTDVLVKELGAIDGIKMNGTKTTNFYVLKNNIVPSVIIELGYLTNEGDLKFVSNAANQDIISERIVSSILEYKD